MPLQYVKIWRLARTIEATISLLKLKPFVWAIWRLDRQMTHMKQQKKPQTIFNLGCNVRGSCLKRQQICYRVAAGLHFEHE
tara:strand:+ start:16627 stop:16869 length:243 start_codon:yes stop_codon:yes gene_type:complete